MERCTKLRGECHDGRCYDDTPHACHDVNCTTERLRKQLADAQATVEALQRERDEAIREHGKESGFWGRSCARLLDKRDELQAALTPVEGGQDE